MTLVAFAAAFRVDGVPRPQPRPRAFARKCKDGTVRARVFEAGTAEGWKAAVVMAGREHRPESPLEGPVSVSIDFFLPRPKRLMRRKDPDGPVPCVAKPDRDNLDKAVLDALVTDGWFRDDAQVVAGEVRKFYPAKAGRPGAWIRVEAVE